MSLTNPKDVVTEERLKDFYDGIYPYLGGMPEILANKFSRSDIYSTTEKLVGQYKDGKPLYMKVVECGALPNATTKTVAHNIANVNRVVFAFGSYYDSSSGEGAFVPTLVSTNAWNIYLKANRTNVIIETASNYPSAVPTAIVDAILFYTKTTDSAISIGVDTDYSTTEKIVGTWIDGKYLYQKTIVDTMPTVTTAGTRVQKYIPIGASIDNVAFCFVQAKTSSGVIMPLFASAASDKAQDAGYNIRLNSASSNANSVQIYSGYSSLSGVPVTITIQYTKTS